MVGLRRLRARGHRLHRAPTQAHIYRPIHANQGSAWLASREPYRPVASVMLSAAAAMAQIPAAHRVVMNLPSLFVLPRSQHPGQAHLVNRLTRVPRAVTKSHQAAPGTTLGRLAR